VHGRKRIRLTVYGIYHKYAQCARLEVPLCQKLLRPSNGPTNMLRRNLITLPPKSPLGYLVNTPRALHILLTHKLRDVRFQLLLTRSVCLLLLIIGFGVCGFFLVPTFWAVSAVAPVMLLFALFLSIGAGNLFLQFALEDERFFDVATRSHALSVFQDTDQSLPQPPR
jgi:hypothetical protein